MTVLTREVLESSSLADLHALAGELAIDGFRRLRREDLVDSITARRGGTPESDERSGGRRRRRGGRSSDEATPVSSAEQPSASDERGPRRRRRGGDDQADNGRDRDRGRGRNDAGRDDRQDGPRGERQESPRGERQESPRGERQESARGERQERRADGDEQVVEGTVTIAPNGSAMLQVSGGPEVYVSAGQVRRCELVDGDRVTGPTRPPRNSERFASLTRIASINGTSADETSTGTRFDDLPVVRPSELFALESDDPTVTAIAWLTPLGRGSRAVIAGPQAAGKSEALRRLGVALQAVDGLELLPVLAGVRPEEIADWRAAGLEPVVALDLAGGPDQRAKAIDEIVERGRRTAARGGHAVLLIDTLDGLGDAAARRILAAARKLEAGGSLTIIATRETPVGGESTVVQLDHALTSTGRFPSLDLATSGTLRPELLVGDEGAAAIAKARADLR